MAKQVLDNAQWFGALSEPLKEDVAKIMKLIDATEGQVLVEEGKPINDFFIVESGILIRSKRTTSASRAGSEADGDATDPDDADRLSTLLRMQSLSSGVSENSSQDEVEAMEVEVDELGPGRTTGFLHVVGHLNEKAFAKVAAAKGGAKVWMVSGDDFRQMLASNSIYSLEVIASLTGIIRTTSNSVRAVLHSSDHRKSISGHGGSKTKVLKVLCYDTTSWVKETFEPQLKAFNEKNEKLRIEMDYTQDRLDSKTAMFAAGHEAICLFVNDTADAEALRILSMAGVKMIAMRCAGFDRVDIKYAKAFALSVARVPAYSPYAVAEHAIALLMTVNRKIHTASTRVKMANFTLDSGLLGMDIHGKTVGVMGTGKIGTILCRIIKGFGANLLAYDVFQNDEVKEMGTYVEQEEIFKQCHVIFIMMPLLPATKHTINAKVLPLLKKGVIIVNTSRGALVDTEALLSGMQAGIIGGCGLDVYENEADYFFQDWSSKNIEDSTLVRLMGRPNVVLTAHQAFFTREAIEKIVSTTIENLSNYWSGLRGKELPNSVC